jgi:hypothetical protein
MEQQVAKSQGEQFLIQSSDKIQYIMGLILQDELDELYNMYSNSFDIYMQACNNDIEQVCMFNTVFIVLVHITMKIIRKNKF